MSLPIFNSQNFSIRGTDKKVIQVVNGVSGGVSLVDNTIDKFPITKTLISGDNIDIKETSPDGIIISGNDAIGSIDNTIGSGEPLVVLDQPDPLNPKVKRVVAGDNMALDVTDENITWNAVISADTYFFDYDPAEPEIKFIVPSDPSITSMSIFAQAGGGGGGGSQQNGFVNYPTASGGGGGGSSGEFEQALQLPLNLGQEFEFKIGAGGVGGAGGITPTAGGNGEITQVLSNGILLINCAGGLGGSQAPVDGLGGGLGGGSAALKVYSGGGGGGNDLNTVSQNGGNRGVGGNNQIGAEAIAGQSWDQGGLGGRGAYGGLGGSLDTSGFFRGGTGGGGGGNGLGSFGKGGDQNSGGNPGHLGGGGGGAGGGDINASGTGGGQVGGRGGNGYVRITLHRSKPGTL